MRKVAILIRVYNRIEDLKLNLQIIVDSWQRHDYYVIVVSNGYNDGYILEQDDKKYIDKLVVLDDNVGHRKGNSQLLIEGVKYIPKDCSYTIILEADTWIYKDRIIKEYIDEMDQKDDVVWASAEWYDKQYGMATDFAIIKTKYILDNPKLFDFDLFPECYISNFLRDTNKNYIPIIENMPVHVPSYVFKYPYVNNSKERRFYVFPDSRTVTHHIEYLKKGMSQKKRYFNIVCGIDYFSDEKVKFKKWKLQKMKFWISLSTLFPKKSWVAKKRYMNINKE